MREATAPAAAPKQQPEQQTEFKEWLVRYAPRQAGTDSEVERVNQVADVSTSQAQHQGPEYDRH